MAGMMVFGALFGLVMSVFIPPRYEATALLTTNLEVVTNTTVTEIMVDAQVHLVGTLVFHPDVVAKVQGDLALNGLELTATELIKKTKIERQLMSTLVKVRDNNPETAALIATAWVTEAYNRLTEAYPHAVALSEAKATQAMIRRCVDDPTKQDLPFCQSLTVERAEELLNETESIILIESPLSLGLTSELNVSQFQPAIVPARPVEYQRSVLILAGAMAGLLFALFSGELIKKDHHREQA